MQKICVVIWSLLVGCSLHAQVATGVSSQFMRYETHGFDTINVGNLNVYFNLPIFSKQGRGQSSFLYGLSYNSSIWTPQTIGGSTAWVPAAQWGWGLKFGATTGSLNYSSVTSGSCSATGIPITKQSNFSYVEPNGASHAFSGSVSSCSSNSDYSGFTVTASDGSGFTLTVNQPDSFVLNDVHGSTITPATNSSSSVAVSSDLWGNQITANAATGTITDATGTTVLVIAGSGTSSSPLTYNYPVWLREALKRHPIFG